MQVAASLNNTDLAKLAYTHNLDRTASVGAEVSKKVTDSAESPTKFQVGYAKRLQGGGLAKARLDNAGELPGCSSPQPEHLLCGFANHPAAIYICSVVQQWIQGQVHLTCSIWCICTDAVKLCL